jgi:hypothetical protein
VYNPTKKSQVRILGLSNHRQVHSVAEIVAYIVIIENTELSLGYWAELGNQKDD